MSLVVIYFSPEQIKITTRPSPARPGRKKLQRDMAQPASQKKITTRHWPAGPASCLVNYFLHNSVSCTNTVLPKITTRPRMKNYNAASGLAQAKKITTRQWPAGQGKKITTRHWLPAGWLSCHVVIYFSAKITTL